MAAIVSPILVGILHMSVHFKELIIPQVENYLQKPIVIMGEDTPIWNAWGVMSVMMGMSFIVIGLLNLATLIKIGENENFPTLSLLGMILYTCSVIYVGHTFNATEQFYGGITGLAMLLICLASNFLNRLDQRTF